MTEKEKKFSFILGDDYAHRETAMSMCLIRKKQSVNTLLPKILSFLFKVRNYFL